MTYAANADSIVERQWSRTDNASIGAPAIADGAILAHRLATATTTAVGDLPHVLQSALGDAYVMGLNSHNGALGAGAKFQMTRGGLGLAVADDAIVVGHPLKAGYQGRVVEFIDASSSGATILAATAGGNAANQPANDIVQIVSSNAGDTTQTVTLIGTTTGTNTIVTQNVAANGTTAVDSAKSDWGVVVAVKVSAAFVGTLTIRKKTGPATIITLAPGVLQAGVTVIAGGAQAYYQFPTATASGASTKQAAFQGLDSTGAVVYDSIPLNGTTPATFAVVAPKRVTEVYLLDVATATNTTIKVGAADAANKYVGQAEGQAAVQGDLISIYINPS